MSALELGCIYALVALALFLSFRILNIADMTTDGAFTLGCAVSATIAVAGHPLLALPAAMLAGAEDALRQSGYEPYYLYRQKYMSGSFENTGWCRPGYTGLYNIYMMEELHTILSLGGGGMNKINLPEEKLARYHNPKIPQDYISRIDTILQQKDEIFSILRGLREQNP